MQITPIKSVSSIQQEFTKKFEQVAQAQEQKAELEQQKLNDTQARLDHAKNEAKAARKSITAINNMFGA